MEKEPILTCCGHLFCLPLFYQLPFADSTSKECLVCKGEVADSIVTPIYGNEDGESVTELESRLKIPPRTKSHRVESAIQQHVAQGMTHGFSHIPVAEALRRIRNSIGLGQHQQQDTGGFSVTFVKNSPQVLQTSGTDSLNSRRLRSRLFSRVLSEGAASLSSKLDSALQMFEDLAASLTDWILKRGDASVLPAINEDGDSFRRDAAIIQSEASSAESAPSSSQANENLSTDAGNTPISQSSLASRRRSILERLSDVDVHAARRRILN